MYLLLEIIVFCRNTIFLANLNAGEFVQQLLDQSR